MTSRVNILMLSRNILLALLLTWTTVLSDCPIGFITERDQSGRPACVDEDECAVEEEDDWTVCGMDATCHNTNGSYYCQCMDGLRSSLGQVHFTANMPVRCLDINECVEGGVSCGPNAECDNIRPGYVCYCREGFTSGMEVFKQEDNVICTDRDECLEPEDLCGPNAECHNTPGSYSCVCNHGFGLTSGKTNFTGSHEQCLSMCVIDKTICGNGTCHPEADGHRCACHAGFANYGDKKSRCTALNCDLFTTESNLEQSLPGAQDVLSQFQKACESPADLDKLDAEDMLRRLLAMIDKHLTGRPVNDVGKLSAMLDTVEVSLKLIGPFIRDPHMTLRSTAAELELRVQRGAVVPQGPVSLSSQHALLDLHWETAAGEASTYPGFTTVSLLTYRGLENSTAGQFNGMKAREDERFQINSKVVTAAVSNRDTHRLRQRVNLTFYHLEEDVQGSPTCVYWDLDNRTWSSRGCILVETSRNSTVCSCDHLSSFAVLMALYDFQDPFELQLVTWFGLSLSLLCLALCILTFALVHSIQSPRTTMHLHLCICLFLANLIFLAGITRTENTAGCAVVAGLLHFFYLAAFCWMCLEGVQLFRMVVLVFNTSFSRLYMMAGGYGVPVLIVAISALANAKGYGTKKHCWLNWEDGFIWSFFGPVCFIILVNIFFFLVTVWKLAQKFSSLNPDLDNLHKIKAFTVTAVAQLVVLGTMWIFGCFQFEKGTMVMSYLFTILCSLQGVLLFIMHCLLSKQVREEYGKCLSWLCAPQKKRYSEFSSSQSSKVPSSRTGQNTNESHI